MTNPVVQKLKRGAPLSAEDQQALADACKDVRAFAPRADIIVEGDRPKHVHVVLEGFACRYKILSDGGRQIMAWLVPGDFCDLHVAVLGAMDHSISCISPSKVAFIHQDVVEALLASSRALTRAMWWATLVDESILREWLVNIGRRPADTKIAHLFCELLVRLQTVGLAPDGRLDLPITQAELADSVGLSGVHVNRVIQQLRELGLIEWREKTLAIKDPDGLTAFAGFDANYLHLARKTSAAL